MNALEIKDSVQQGRVAIGTWVFEFNSPGLPRLLKSAGVDFVVYDMEHSGFGIDSVRNLIALSRPLNLAALVRPPAGNYHLIAPLLDIGAAGIIAPMVESAKAASQVTAACRYSPRGRRGAAFSVAHDDFLPGDVPTKMEAANDAMLCGVLIESERGVGNLDEILAVPGIDLVWVGHLDLSISMGIPGQFEHPKFLETADRIIKKCKHQKIPLGILVSDTQQGIERVRQGFQLLSYSGDLWLFQRALLEGVRGIREGLSRI